MFFGRRLAGRVCDDQRRSGLIHEDAVRLVDDRVVQPALNPWIGLAGAAEPGCPNGSLLRLSATELQPIAQEVEAELARRAIGEIAFVHIGANIILHLLLQAADTHAKHGIHWPHLVGITLSQIIVDRRNVNTLATQRIQGMQVQLRRASSLRPSPVQRGRHSA